MREPSEGFKTVTDIIAAVVLLVFFIDMVQWLSSMNRYSYSAGFIITFYFWAVLFAIIFLFSMLYFFKKLIFERSAYTLSSKIIVLSVIAWLSLPFVGNGQSYAIFSPLWIFIVIFIFILGKRFLKWAKSEDGLKNTETEEGFFWHPRVSRECEDYYAYRVGWMAFLISIVLSFLLVFALLLGQFVNVDWVYYGRYAPQKINYALAFSVAFSGTLAFIFEFTMFFYLLTKGYAEDGISGVFALAGVFAYSPSYLYRHLGEHSFVVYGLIILLFIFALVFGIEILEEWMEHRQREKSMNRKQWLTFR